MIASPRPNAADIADWRIPIDLLLDTLQLS
jgi:hypothetical protein